MAASCGEPGCAASANPSVSCRPPGSQLEKDGSACATSGWTSTASLSRSRFWRGAGCAARDASRPPRRPARFRAHPGSSRPGCPGGHLQTGEVYAGILARLLATGRLPSCLGPRRASADPPSAGGVPRSPGPAAGVAEKPSERCPAPQPRGGGPAPRPVWQRRRPLPRRLSPSLWASQSRSRRPSIRKAARLVGEITEHGPAYARAGTRRRGSDRGWSSCRGPATGGFRLTRGRWYGSCWLPGSLRMGRYGRRRRQGTGLG